VSLLLLLFDCCIAAVGCALVDKLRRPFLFGEVVVANETAFLSGDIVVELDPDGVAVITVEVFWLISSVALRCPVLLSCTTLLLLSSCHVFCFFAGFFASMRAYLFTLSGE
jgi:hypothetical protein